MQYDISLFVTLSATVTVEAESEDAALQEAVREVRTHGEVLEVECFEGSLTGSSDQNLED